MNNQIQFEGKSIELLAEAVELAIANLEKEIDGKKQEIEDA